MHRQSNRKKEGGDDQERGVDKKNPFLKDRRKSTHLSEKAPHKMGKKNSKDCEAALPGGASSHSSSEKGILSEGSKGSTVSRKKHFPERSATSRRFTEEKTSKEVITLIA